MTGVDKLQEGTPVTVQLADDTGGKLGANTKASKTGGKKK
jgi:hypothetical protein